MAHFRETLPGLEATQVYLENLLRSFRDYRKARQIYAVALRVRAVTLREDRVAYTTPIGDLRDAHTAYKEAFRHLLTAKQL